MLIITSKLPWRRQPPAPTAVNWAHPLSNGLVAHMLPQNNILVNHALNNPNNIRIEETSRSGITTDSYEEKVVLNRSTQTGEIVLTGGSSFSSAQKISIIGSLSRSSGTSISSFFLGQDNSTRAGLYIGANGVTFINASAYVYAAYSNKPLHDYAAIYDGTLSSNKARLFENGVELSLTSSGTMGSALATITNLKIALSIAAAPNGIGLIGHNLLYNRAISAEEVLALYNNPYQMLAPTYSRRYFIPLGGGNSQTISLATGHISVTGYAPVIAQPNTIVLEKGSVSITGYAPVIVQPNAIALEKGSVNITGYIPVILQNASQTVQLVTGHVSISGYAPTVLQPRDVGLTTGHITYTGHVPTVRQGESQVIELEIGHIAITGYAPTVLQPNTVGLEIGHIVYTGHVPTVRQVIAGIVDLITGHVVITGYAPTVRQIEPETVIIQDVFSLLHATIFDDVNIGEWVVYTAPNGAPVSVRASITRNAQLVGEYGQVLENRMIARLPLSSVTPVLGGRVTIGARTYTVEKQISENSHVTEVLLR